jgi:hypothetical protein
MSPLATDCLRHLVQVASGTFDQGNAVARLPMKSGGRGAVRGRDQGEKIADLVPRPSGGQYADGGRIAGLAIEGARQAEDAGQVVGTINLPALALCFCPQEVLEASSQIGRFLTVGVVAKNPGLREFPIRATGQNSCRQLTQG